MKRTVVELWDVLSIAIWVSVQLTNEFYYTWSITVAVCCVCMNDRDLEVHEIFAAMYMLRSTCGALRSPNAALCLPIIALACVARTEGYLKAAVFARRRCVLLCVFLCLTMLHNNADPTFAAIGRLVMYVATTRYACVKRVDPYDAVAQCAWMLSVPYYVLPLAVLQLNTILDLFPTRQRRRQAAVWREVTPSDLV